MNTTPHRSWRLILLSVLALSCAMGPQAYGQQAVAQDDSPSRATEGAPTDLTGVWVAERSFGPIMRGPVTVQRATDEGWIARLQGETTVAVAGDNPTWTFEYPGHGRFQGRPAADGGEIRGHWIQAPGLIDNYPLATPVRLRPAGKDLYTGHITPYPQEVSLNIALMAGSDGGADEGRYRAFLRNPQRNLGVFLRIAAARVDGDRLQFTNAEGDLLVTAKIREAGERLTLVFPRFSETLDFTRRSRRDAPGFYPRQSPAPAKDLVRPAEIDDGWPTATPSSTGLDPQPLLSLVNELAAFEPGGLRQPYIHSLLIAHRGKLVLEEYFHGYHRERTHDSRSAGKTIASALLGIALQQGKIDSIDAPAYPFYGGVDAFANPDPRKARISLKHLVTMTAGFDCDDDDYDNPGNEDIMQSQEAQPDWYRYALDLPLVRAPGAAGVYCTAGINLLGGAISKATGTDLLRFFHEQFALPLGIDHYHANLSPTQQMYLGGGLRLRPRDFLKLGQTFLDDGVWRGQRLLSAAWVHASFEPQASLNEPQDYGLAWWRRAYTVNGRTIQTHYASGNGGQMLFVVPELELTLMIHAGNYGDGRTRNRFRDRFLQEYILPAAVPDGG